jgi:hypothetical protein
MGSTFGLAFSLSHFIFLFWFVLTPATSKGPLTDEQIMIIPARLCHFLMCEYISPRGAYHVFDGHMAQFPALCDYIEQGWAKQLETQRKFVDLYRCINLYIGNLYHIWNLYDVRWWILVYVNMCLMMYLINLCLCVWWLYIWCSELVRMTW